MLLSRQLITAALLLFALGAEATSPAVVPEPVASGANASAAPTSEFARRHAAFGLKAPYENASCLGCHGSYEALAEKTATLEPNPHRNHMGHVQCESCHAMESEPRLMCNDCHSFPALDEALRKTATP